MQNSEQIYSQNLSGDPAIQVASTDRITISTGVTITGTGNNRYIEMTPDGPDYNFSGSEGQGAIELAAKGGQVKIETGATVIGANFGITTPDNFQSDMRASTNMTIENHGTVIGEFNDGIRLFNHATIVNTGQIIGGHILPDPTNSNIGGSLGDAVSSAITGQQTLADFPNDGVVLRLNNSGTIDGRRMGIIASSGSYIVNSGTIHGDSSGIVMQNSSLFGGPNVILAPAYRGWLENSGTITATFQNGANVMSTMGVGESYGYDLDLIDPEDYDFFDTYNRTDASAVMINSGLIETFADASGASTGVVTDPVTGEQIPVQGSSQFFAFRMTSANGYILNAETGTIRALNGANALRMTALDTMTEASGVIVLDNQGTIIGGIVGANVGTDDVEIAGQEIIRNNGLIQGDVALGAGDDVFWLAEKGIVTGTIDMGDGDDLMIWNTQATVGDIVTGGSGSNILALILGGDQFDATRVFNFDRVLTFGAGNLEQIDLGFVPEIQVNDGVSLDIGKTNFGGVAFINPGGKLVGIGEVEAIVVRGAATISPGNSIGTINVTGDVTFSSDTTFDVEVSKAGSDQVLATGIVSLAGGEIIIRGENGVDLKPGEALTSYVVLSGAGGFTGRFAELDDQLRFYDVTLDYSATQLVVKLDPVGADFRGAASTFNERGVGAVLYDGLLGASGDFLSAMKTSFPGLSTDEVRLGLSTLAGPSHAWTPLAVSETGLQIAKRVTRTRWQESGQSTLWAGGLYSTLKIDNSAEVAGNKTHAKAGLIGYDHGLSDSVNLGAFVGLANTSSKDNVGGDIDGGGWVLGAKAAARLGSSLTLSGHLGYISQEIDVRRDIDIGNLSRLATSKYDVDGAFFGAQIGWHTAVGQSETLGLFASYDQGKYEGESFAEAGADSLSLRGTAPEYTRKTYRIGGRLDGDYSWGRPSLEIGYQMDRGPRYEIVESSFAGIPGNFDVRSARMDKSLPFIGVGADFNLSSSMTGTVRYDGLYGDDSKTHGFVARLNMTF